MSEENLNCSFVSIHYIICECGETFPSEDALRDHLEKEHPHKRERKEYKCGICSNVYDTEDECIQHYEASHMPVDIDMEHCEAEDDDEFEDEQKPFLEEGEMAPETVALEEAIESIKEETIEEGEIPLEEGQVPVLIDMPRLPAKKGRKVVPRTTGSEDQEMVFVIEHGQKRGKLVSMIRKRSRIPKGAKNVTCEVCGKCYASNAALRYHQRTHTGERPYRCNLCPKAFTMPLFLQIHVRTHTGERPYECANCPKAFSNKAALMRHERVHTGEKPYKCPMCVKSFTQSNSMKLHVTTVHLKQPTPYKSKNRKLKEARSQGKWKVNPNPRKKIPAIIDSVEVLKNGLESYVLGPLKADLENLKADIDMLARGEFEEELTAVESIEVKDDAFEEDNEYEMKDDVYEVIEEVLYDDEDTGDHCEVVLSEMTS